jgi:hypothetical protein
MKKIVYAFVAGVCLTALFSYTLSNGVEIKGNILNTTEIPIQQKLVKVIENEVQANQMIRSGFVLQDVDISDNKTYYTLILY